VSGLKAMIFRLYNRTHLTQSSMGQCTQRWPITWI